MADVFEELLQKYRRVWALKYASALLGWDSETYMPEGSAKERGEVLATLTSMKQEIFTSREFLHLLERAEERAQTDVERGIVRVLKRTVRYYTLIPREVLEELERTTSEAKVAWRAAKKRADFGKFAPYLEKIVELNRKIAEFLGYDKHPYDALLDLYEEGFTTDDADSLFEPLIKSLRRELNSLINSGWPAHHPLEEKPYPQRGMEELNRKLLDLLGFEWNYMRLDVSTHPFTENMGLFDVRITTWYHERDFRRSLLATIHEFGHALYERQIDPELWMTPVGEGVSLGVHESQSRFWENVVGRSHPFTKLLAPLIEEFLNIQVDPEDLFLYFNVVRPSLIRVEADEVTYNLHIALRYEIERDLVEGALEVKELPQVWNEKMEELLGVIPPDDSKGVLQDIHWSLGAIGYFPTYTIGTVLAVQLRDAMEKDLDLDSLVESGEFGPIREWLKERVHRWGSIYPPKELIKRATGEELNPYHFLHYIKEKYRG